MSLSRDELISNVENERLFLETKLKEMIKSIGQIPIADKKIMPFGWRKAAKGRTVWRILEEIISQNLELNATKYGFDSAEPAESEVGVYDFKFEYNSGNKSYINIKSAVENGKRNKDDLSKAEGLKAFYAESPDANLYIASFVIRFNDNMTIEIVECHVFPITWIPDVYVNPSNNGNLQSAYYKDLDSAVKRTNAEFIEVCEEAYAIAQEKKKKKK